MSIERRLLQQFSACEICQSTENLSVVGVEPLKNKDTEDHVLVCGNCKDQIENKKELDAFSLRGLQESIWSEKEATKVLSYRLLFRLGNMEVDWAKEAFESAYLEEDTLSWAEATGELSTSSVVHKDSNGAVLLSGDNVVLIKDLVVKGGGFTAKRGTAVRKITLVHDNPDQIEGKVEGQHIVILTQFVKKTS
ncbi:MAG: hypothetical protein C4K58_05450 [Flavobacteriaceae bacterium]|nr:MAG: hypothetical protein C4K58_05450 [Flavobacteriaceae bacterium]